MAEKLAQKLDSETIHSWHPCDLAERKIQDDNKEVDEFLTVPDTVNLTVNIELKKLSNCENKLDKD